MARLVALARRFWYPAAPMRQGATQAVEAHRLRGSDASAQRFAVALTATLAVFGVELVYLVVHRVASVPISLATWSVLAVQAFGFAAMFGACTALFVAARDYAAGALSATALAKTPVFGEALLALLFAALCALTLLATTAPLTPLDKALGVSVACVLGLSLMWILRALRAGRAQPPEAVATSNLTSLLAAGCVCWFLYEGNFAADLEARKFGVADAMGRNATLATCAVPLAVMLLVPWVAWVCGAVARWPRLRWPALVGALAAIALLQHVNAVLYPDSYYHYHRILSLLSLALAYGLSALVIEPRTAPAPTPRRRRALLTVLLAGFAIPMTTLPQGTSAVAYVASIHTVWLRLGYDVTGSLRRLMIPKGVAPPRASEPAVLGEPATAYERKPRDVVLFLLDAQRADGYSLQGPLAAHMPRTVQCFEGAFELRRAFSAGTCTEVAYPALHSSTSGARRGQVRGRDLATPQWLARTKSTSLSQAMSAAGHRTVLLSDPWYLEAFFDPPRWSPIFGRFDEVLRASAERPPKDAWDATVLDRTGGKPLFLVVHLAPHGLKARPELDAAIGTICDSLSARGRLADAVLLLTADHGWQHFEHGRETYGRTLFNEEARVPLFVRLPGLSGGPLDFNVAFVDHLPTLLDLQGAGPAQQAEGQSYLPLLLGGKPNPARPIFMETRMDVWGSTAVLRGDLKLIRWHTPGVEALFDLRRDPGERQSILGEPSVGRELAELRGWLDAFTER